MKLKTVFINRNMRCVHKFHILSIEQDTLYKKKSEIQYFLNYFYFELPLKTIQSNFKKQTYQIFEEIFSN